MTEEITGLLLAGVLGDIATHAAVFVAGEAFEEAGKAGVSGWHEKRSLFS
jgi:hypothetical protein